MANQQSRQFKLKKIEVTSMGEEEKTFDIRDVVLDFSYKESIEAAFTSIEFTIADSVDFNLQLTGGETVKIDLETNSSKDGALKMKFRIYKIGKIIKSERGQIYILYCCSPEMYNNEINKVFKAFGAISEGSSKDVENIPKYICKKYLKAKGTRLKEENFENHSRITFVSPNWRPADAIAYVSDKVTRLSSSKGSNKQSGFLFYENRRGFQFRSIDGLCEQGFDITFTYRQQGQLDEDDDGYYIIESIQYPDKANHLRHMRMGTYKTVTTGISLAVPTDNNITESGGGNNKKKSPSGTIYPARETGFDVIFSRATPLEKNPPFNMPEEVKGEGAPPTRQKMRVLHTLKNEQKAAGGTNATGNPNNGTDPFDNLAVAEYAAARYNLMKAIQLQIIVPGNTGICAGDIVNLIIPASQEKGKNVQKDKKFSGKYIIAAHTFVYSKNGCNSELLLIRDSLPK
jgi:hypothetical protein